MFLVKVGFVGGGSLEYRHNENSKHEILSKLFDDSVVHTCLNTNGNLVNFKTEEISSVEIEELHIQVKKKYLVALPSFPEDKSFNCPTVLVSATSESDAIDLVRKLKGNVLIGSIKLAHTQE